MQLHRGGRWRAWLGRQFGGETELGDRIWRRCLHLIGALVLVYYLLPTGFFVVLPNSRVLLLALFLVLLLEALRILGRIELPTIRPHEHERVASFAYYAVALVAAVLLFPEPIAIAVVLGTAIVDPVIGELRRLPKPRPAQPVLPLLVYSGLAFAALRGIGGWGVHPAILATGIAAVAAVGIESLRMRSLDDDLTMTLVPGVILTTIVWLVPSFPSWAG
ncbi:MAG: hypothetical protein L3J93_00585 [Thermoplasmata archaeon]|nr:hypothetical protein [Thermoplasmata archaeon]